MYGPEQRTFLLLILVILGLPSLTGQTNRRDPRLQEWEALGARRDSLSAYISTQYGPDQVLLNGYQYYEAYRRYKGMPYLSGEDFHTGSISRGGINFENLRLKYDCFAHLLIVEYSQAGNSYNRVMIHDAGTDSFRMGNVYFIKTSLNGEPPAYYQLIKADPLTCFVRWEKDLIPLSNDLRYPYEFSRSRASIYVMLGQDLYHVQGLKSYTSLFPGTMSKPLRKYCRKNQFRFSKAEPETIEQLIRFTAGEFHNPEEL